MNRNTSKGLLKLLASTLLIVSILSSCNKPGEVQNPQQPFHYSSDVLDKWMSLQIRLMKNSVGIPNHGLARHMAYSGVVAVESLAPGLPAHQQWSSKWNGLTGLPQLQPSQKLFYPSSLNAAMAAINKAMFTTASPTDKQAIDSLENAISQSFIGQTSAVQMESSVLFGKSVAAAVFAWSQTDGASAANNPYTLQTGPGLWKPTPPAFAPPATPYWGNNRTIVAGSTVGAAVPPPPSYSTVPGSPFYEMVKTVYDASLNLTQDQQQMATFWRDVPGATTPGHWLSIVQQVTRNQQADLAKAALAYALTGVAINDALIICFKGKYQYLLLRPVTYIRETMGHSIWSSYIGTPAHPEYPSAHASLSVAAASVLQKLFPHLGAFTDHTYDYLGLPARSYSSIGAAGLEAGQSRLYAGIHYQQSIDAAQTQGLTVAENIFAKKVND